MLAMNSWIARAVPCALVIGAMAGCSEVPAEVKPQPMKIVQIGTVNADNFNITCTDPQGGFEQQYHVNFQVEMVNTTDDDVSVVGVSSRGNIAQSTIPGETGAPAQVFASLPFLPQPALVRAHDGDVLLNVAMTAGCGTATITDPLTRVIVTTLLVTTNSGQYATVPLTFNGIWTHAQLMPGSVRKL
jgi:hypothetical protein